MRPTRTITNPAATAITPVLPYKRPVKYPAAPKRMITAIRITQLAPLTSVAFIAPVAAEVTTATVCLPLYSEGSDFWGTPPKLKSASVKAFFLIARFL
jgi:hypothetical protein